MATRAARSERARARRYGAFYAIAIVIAVLAVVLPSRGGDEDDGDAGTDEVAAGGDADAAWAPASGGIEAGTGTTVGGVACKEGVKQVPDLQYSVPCVPKFTGDNGGATSQGVTGVAANESIATGRASSRVSSSSGRR